MRRAPTTTRRCSTHHRPRHRSTDQQPPSPASAQRRPTSKRPADRVPPESALRPTLDPPLAANLATDHPGRPGSVQRLAARLRADEQRESGRRSVRPPRTRPPLGRRPAKLTAARQPTRAARAAMRRDQPIPAASNSSAPTRQPHPAGELTKNDSGRAPIAVPSNRPTAGKTASSRMVVRGPASKDPTSRRRSMSSCRASPTRSIAGARVEPDDVATCQHAAMLRSPAQPGARAAARNTSARSAASPRRLTATAGRSASATDSGAPRAAAVNAPASGWPARNSAAIARHRSTIAARVSSSSFARRARAATTTPIATTVTTASAPSNPSARTANAHDPSAATTSRGRRSTTHAHVKAAPPSTRARTHDQGRRDPGGGRAAENGRVHRRPLFDDDATPSSNRSRSPRAGPSTHCESTSRMAVRTSTKPSS